MNARDIKLAHALTKVIGIVMIHPDPVGIRPGSPGGHRQKGSWLSKGCGGFRTDNLTDSGKRFQFLWSVREPSGALGPITE